MTTALSGKSATGHTHTVADVTDITATAAELNYTTDVTSLIQAQLDSKSGTSHNHSNATSSADGFMSNGDFQKLVGIATSANNYSHPSGDGNLHIPATGASNDGKVLTAGSTAGSLSWASTAGILKSFVSYTASTTVAAASYPTGATQFIAWVYGGGGGGGNNTQANAGFSGDGGQGAKLLRVGTLGGTSLSIVIGTAGTHSGTPGAVIATGSTGGTTTLTPNGASASAAISAPGGTGGIGGNAMTDGTDGTIEFYGEAAAPHTRGAGNTPANTTHIKHTGKGWGGAGSHTNTVQITRNGTDGGPGWVGILYF
jgi:hypothetical protein